MRLTDRYILSELTLPFVISTFAVLMMLVGNTLYAVLDRMLQEKWPLEMVTRMLVLNIPTVLEMTLPVAVALAASLAVNRMARDLEMTVLRAAGQSLARTFLPIIFFGALVCAGDFYIGEKIVPWTFKEQRNVESLLYNLPKDPVQGGRSLAIDDYLITFNSAQQKIQGRRFRFNKVILIRNPNRFSGSDDQEFATVLVAQSAEYEKGVWYLDDVHTYRYNTNGTTLFVDRSAQMQVNLQINFSSVYNPPSDWAMHQQSFEELTQLVKEARRQHRMIDANKLEVNRCFKLTLPLMCLVFAICSPPLTLRFARTGAFTGVLLSIVVVFVGWNTLLLLKGVALGGYIPPLAAALATPVLFAGLGMWLLRVQE